MPDLPTQRELEEPALEALRLSGGSATLSDIYRYVTGLYPAEWDELRYPLSDRLILRHRIRLALRSLGGRGIVENPRPRSTCWRLTA